MEPTNEEWVNNECGDFMWDDALKHLNKVSPTELNKEVKTVSTQQSETEIARN